MAVIFREVSYPPIQLLSTTAPDGAVVGVVGEDGSGKNVLLRLAAGQIQPVSGELHSTEPRRFIGVADPLDLSPAGTLALDHVLACHDSLVRGQTALAIERLRKGGATILLSSHEEDVIRTLSDEVWWLDGGRLAEKGDPEELLGRYRRHVSRRFQEWGTKTSQTLSPSLRRGDGRAEVRRVEILNSAAQPCMVWRSGEEVAVSVTVAFARDVPDPVVGIMIRTRIGFEVFGTNTELERMPIGACRAGDTVCVTFRFRCDLCPRDYTVTAASHDPDGVWHDWVEDAVAVSVTDDRFTAGVANLRARIEVDRPAVRTGTRE